MVRALYITSNHNNNTIIKNESRHIHDSQKIQQL